MTTVTGPIGLTTIFTPPASCAGVVTYDGSEFWQGELSLTGDVNCYPQSFSLIHESFYSPGICPLGWNSVSSYTGTGALVFNTAESNALCCPIGYTYVTPGVGPNAAGSTGLCGSSLHGVLTNVFSTSTLASGPLPDDPSLTSVTIAQVTASVTPTAWAELIQVRWQATDTEIISLMAAKATMTIATTTIAAKSPSSSSSSSSSSSTAGSSSNTTPSSVAGNSSSSTGSSSGLSTGAKIGLGVGIPVGLLAIIIGVFLVMRKHKQRRTKAHHAATQETAPTTFGSAYLQPKPELDGRSNMTQTPMYQPNSKPELDGRSNMTHTTIYQPNIKPKQGYYELAGQLHQNYDNVELPG